MEKIIQLTEKEYLNLVNAADANETVIDEKVKKEVVQKTTLDVRLDVSVGDDWNGVAYFDIGCWAKEKNQSLSEKQIAEICDEIEEGVNSYMQRRFGKQIMNRNYFVSNLRKQDLWQTIQIVFAVVGWVLAAAFFVAAMILY